MIDERFARHLHVESLRHRDLHPEHESHVLFQASTIGALLDGAYDGDVTFAELGEHGDLGLGTLNALDGEMIALDGVFLRADTDGLIEEIDPAERTPFAVVVWFEPSVEREIAATDNPEGFLRQLEEVAAGEEACALRVDGEFARVRARSVPRQLPPYRPLAEVVEEQSVFEFNEIEGTLVGFRFPAYAEGLEVPGYHLHFVSADRSRGGHVLECVPRRVTARFDLATELHVELPPGVDLAGSELTRATERAIARVERGP